MRNTFGEIKWDVDRDLRRCIKTPLDREGVQIPYPHRVVFTRPGS